MQVNRAALYKLCCHHHHCALLRSSAHMRLKVSLVPMCTLSCLTHMAPCTEADYKQSFDKVFQSQQLSVASKVSHKHLSLSVTAPPSRSLWCAFLSQAGWDQFLLITHQFPADVTASYIWDSDCSPIIMEHGYLLWCPHSPPWLPTSSPPPISATVKSWSSPYLLLKPALSCLYLSKTG